MEDRNKSDAETALAVFELLRNWGEPDPTPTTGSAFEQIQQRRTRLQKTRPRKKAQLEADFTKNKIQFVIRDNEPDDSEETCTVGSLLDEEVGTLDEQEAESELYPTDTETADTPVEEQDFNKRKEEVRKRVVLSMEQEVKRLRENQDTVLPTVHPVETPDTVAPTEPVECVDQVALGMNVKRLVLLMDSVVEQLGNDSKEQDEFLSAVLLSVKEGQARYGGQNGTE